MQGLGVGSSQWDPERRRIRAKLQSMASKGWGLGLALLTMVGAPRSALAAGPWVDRSLTLPPLVFAGDVGLGVAHYRPLAGDIDRSVTGPGLNLEGALGVTQAVELGVRTGIRFGDDGKALAADAFGRTIFTETYGTNHDSVANPEFRIRWAAYRGNVVEVGLDGRFYMPIEQGSHAGIMVGVPLMFHIGGVARIDTGLYIPVVFGTATSTVLSVPAQLWFQVSNRVWLGPMIALRHVNPGGDSRSYDDLLAGFGLGYQVGSSVDLKWMLLTPNANAESARARIWGGGFGLQFRIGE